MTVDPNDVAVAEYRHEIVMKIAKGIADGSIRFDTSKKHETKDAGFVAQYHLDTLHEVEKFFSGELNPEEFRKVEKSLFGRFMFLRSVHLLDEKETSVSEIQQALKTINEQIETTNKLVVRMMAILNALVKGLDDEK